MNESLANLQIKVLEKMYWRETRILKSRLLSGAFQKNILRQKNKVIELALIIHKKQCCEGIIPDNFSIEQI
jgi:hypothetical protein